VQPRDIKRRLKELAAALKAEPGSIPKRLELAAVLREAGRPAEAIDLYRGVAEAYAEDGRLVQAMAVCKGILDIDPEHRDTLEMLAVLATRNRRPPPLTTVSQVGGRWVAEPAGDRQARADDELTRGGSERSPADADDGERTPVEAELQTPVGGDDNRTPLGERGRADEATRIGADATRAGTVDAHSRQKWRGAPRVATPIAAEAPPDTDPALDFPDETKRAARGHRLLDLTPANGIAALADEEDDGKTLLTPLEAMQVPRAIDTDRMPALSDDEIAAQDAMAAVEAELTRGALPSALDSAHLPPIPNELSFGDEDSAVGLVHDVIDGPFPRPQLTVEPPPFPLLSELPRAAFMDLLARLSVVRLDAGETVLREGEAGDACYLVAAGRVRVTKGGVEVAQLGPGSFFGEFAVLSDQRRHASVQAIEPLELLEIRRELIDELVAAHPGVARTLRTFYRERLLSTLLATAPFFQRLSAEERATIAERFRPRRFGRGAQIIEEGAPGGGLYLILVGEVEVVRAAKAQDDPEHVVKLGTLGEGSYFGEMSLLKGGVASATVRATRMTEAVQLPPRDFYEMASAHPVLWEQLRSEAERRELANHAILAGEARKSDTFYLV
jgi:CRP-like cAMP-binding protein